MPLPSSVRHPIRPRDPQQLGFEGEIHDLGDPEIRTKQRRGKRTDRGVACHPRRRRVDESVGAPQRRAHIAFRVHTTGKRRGQSIRERASALVNGVDDDQLPRAQLERRVRRRRACPAGAKLNDPPESGAWQVLDDTLPEPPPVRVVPDSTATVEDDRVHGADRAGLVRQIGQERHHRLLARVRDVQPGEAHSLGRRQQFRKRLGVQAEAVEIDALVDAAQPVGGRFLFVHRGRARRVDAGADETEEQRARSPRHRWRV